MTMPEEFDEQVALQAPESTELVRGSKLRRAGRLVVALAVLVALAAVGLAAASVTTSGGLRWVVTVILWALAAGTCLLCAHAGGHAWFVPLPALALALLWTIAGTDQRGAGWWLAAACGAAVALGTGVAITALRLRLRGAWTGLPPVANATGATLTPLTPVGVVRVNGESWTAVSLSGPLAAGVPVHVVRVRGMRLEVWSEAGAVPCLDDLETEEGQS